MTKMDVRTQLEDLASQRLSRQQIADALGWHKSKVNHTLIRLGIKTMAPSGQPEGWKERQCRLCGETDPAKFYVNRRLSYSLCRRCKSNLERARYARNRLAAIQWKGGRCQRCGYNRCPAALHFHHLDPTQKDPNWTLLKAKDLGQVKPELEKCELVCANCHAEIHAGWV